MLCYFLPFSFCIPIFFLRMEVGMKVRYSIFVIFGGIEFESVIPGSQDRPFYFLLLLERRLSLGKVMR